jgi:iron complex transport system substrate-binding protein
VPGRGLPAYLDPQIVSSIELVGDTTNPNLEQVAAMQPDLIIGAKVRHEALYDTLSQIAPTVFSESSGTNWTDQVRLTAEALNRVELGEQLLDEFAARAAQVGEAIGADGMTATIVRFLPDQTRLYGPETFSGSVLTAVGFDLGDKGYDPAFSMAIISVEQLEMVDADVLFTTTYADQGSARADFSALWGGLTAVQNGRQFDIADDTWMTGIGVLGANLILDDLETWLAA